MDTDDNEEDRRTAIRELKWSRAAAYRVSPSPPHKKLGDSPMKNNLIFLRLPGTTAAAGQGGLTSEMGSLDRAMAVSFKKITVYKGVGQ